MKNFADIPRFILILLDFKFKTKLPIPGITSRIILERVDISEKKLVSRDSLISQVLNSACGVVAVLGAGDVDRLVQPLAEAFKSFHNKAFAG